MTAVDSQRVLGISKADEFFDQLPVAPADGTADRMGTHPRESRFFHGKINAFVNRLISINERAVQIKDH